MDELELVEARWRLGVYPPEGLPGIARKALEDGHEGTALRALAELHDPQRSAVQSLFEDMLDELGREPMDRERAALLVARDLARKILSGELSPGEGAYKIVWEVWDRNRDVTRLDPWVGLLEKHQGKRQVRDMIAEGIRREAERLLVD